MTRLCAAWLMMCCAGVSLAQANPASEPRVGVAVTVFSALLIAGVPGGWQSAYQSPAPDHFKLSYVPNGQTFQRWQGNLTIEGFRGQAEQPGMSPAVLLDRQVRRIGQDCGERFVVQMFAEAKIDSHDAQSAIIGCGSAAVHDASGILMGEGEAGLYIAIKGPSDMVLIRRAVRGAAYERNAFPIRQADVDAWTRALLPITLCQRGVSRDECWARNARERRP